MSAQGTERNRYCVLCGNSGAEPTKFRPLPNCPLLLERLRSEFHHAAGKPDFQARELISNLHFKPTAPQRLKCASSQSHLARSEQDDGFDLGMWPGGVRYVLQAPFAAQFFDSGEFRHHAVVLVVVRWLFGWPPSIGAFGQHSLDHSLDPPARCGNEFGSMTPKLGSFQSQNQIRGERFLSLRRELHQVREELASLRAKHAELESTPSSPPALTFESLNACDVLHIICGLAAHEIRF